MSLTQTRQEIIQAANAEEMKRHTARLKALDVLSDPQADTTSRRFAGLILAGHGQSHDSIRETTDAVRSRAGHGYAEALDRAWPHVAQAVIGDIDTDAPTKPTS